MPLLFTQTSTPRGRPDIWTSSPNSPQTSGTSAGRPMQSQTPSLEQPSTPYKHHLLTLRRWLEHKPLTQSCEHSSLLPLPLCNSPRSPTCPPLHLSFAIRAQVPRDLSFQPHFDALSLILYTPSHPGVKATTQLITDRYVWPHMNTDIKAWTRCYIPCQRVKIHRHTLTPLSTLPVPDARFQRIHLDIVGPLPPPRGFSYLLTCIDRFSRWPEAFPMIDITAEFVARTFISGWVARFGVPSTVTTDRGRQFESQLWRLVTQLLGCKHLHTTGYHPIATGTVERFPLPLKAPSEQELQLLAGRRHCHSFFSVSALQSRVTCRLVWRSYSMARHSVFQGSFLRREQRRRSVIPHSSFYGREILCIS